MRHLTIDQRWRSQEAYRPKPRKMEVPDIPYQNRAPHGQALLAQAQQIGIKYVEVAREWEEREDIRSKGIIVEIESAPDVPLCTESWSDRKTPKFTLLNEVELSDADGKRILRQRWFIRDGALAEFTKIFQDYLSKNKSPVSEEPKRRELVDSISQIRLAALSELWTDSAALPTDADEAWYEVWLRAGTGNQERTEIVQQFRSESQRLGLNAGRLEERLPEHTVIHVFGPFGRLGQSTALMNCVAEIRRVQNYASIYERLPLAEQQQIAAQLRERVDVQRDSTLALCILDTGVTRGHPLIEDLMAAEDNRTINPAWGTADDQDHGTPMSGLAAYGDLSASLAARERVPLPFRLEAAKIVPPPNVINRDEKHAGEYTTQGVAVTEAARPDRTRMWCLASTMEGDNDGKPSSWSARVDELVAGVDNNGEVRRVFCVSAGNTPSTAWSRYPRANYEAPIENPGQSWNALCVGTYTNLTQLQAAPDRQGYVALAMSGAMAPSNRTARQWGNDFPRKPDIVLEGGNTALRTADRTTLSFPELLLLSTESDFRRNVFCTFDGTSAATALATRLAAHIQSIYPDFWPETVRGLLVHCAEWTTAMRESAPVTNDAGTIRYTERRRRAILLSTVGYGVPNVQATLGSERNRATLIAQAELQPYREAASLGKYNAYHVYSLPWPAGVLESLFDQEVRMRVTLSYFVEPNPGNRVTSRYRYPGCRLKFRVSAPGQRVDDLKAQINKFAADEAKRDNRAVVEGEDGGWLFGSNDVFRGSIHSNIWEGPAASLLDMKHLAIYPTTGWWKTRVGLKKANSTLKYSLIVSLEGASADVDLYAEIANQIAVPIQITAR